MDLNKIKNIFMLFLSPGEKSLVKISLAIVSILFLIFFLKYKIPITIIQENVIDLEAPRWSDVITFPQSSAVYSPRVEKDEFYPYQNEQIKNVIFSPTGITSSSSNPSDPQYLMNATSIQDCVEEGAASGDCLLSNVKDTDDIWQYLEITRTSIPSYGWINTTNNDGTLPTGAIINEVKVCWEGYGADTTKLGDKVDDKCAIAIGENSTGVINWYYVLGPSQAACADGGFQSAVDTRDCFDVTSFINTKEKAENTLIHIYALDSDDRNIEIYIDWMWVNVTYSIDITPPQWSQAQDNSSYKIYRGQVVNISAVWQDDTSLDKAWLSTNETGAWKNYTDGTYDSPRSLSGTGPITVNFTWFNETGKPRVIGWIIYANDTSGNENSTLNQGQIINFTMWGWSNVTWTSPSTGSSYPIGSIIPLTCFVNDTNATGSGPIEGYDVYFYNKSDGIESYLGKNYTNATGYAVFYWNTSSLSSGTYYPKCNITDNSTLYYGASEYNQANTSIDFTVIYSEVRLVSLDPLATTYVIQNQTFFVNATVICRGGDCGNVNATLRYNATSSFPDTPINTSEGEKPFYVQEPPYPSNATKYCVNNPLTQDEFCNITWTVNATGDIDTEWKIGVLFESDNPSISKNHTSNATLYIAFCTEEIGLAWSSIDFGLLGPNTNYNSAPYNDQNFYNITNKGTCTLNLWIRGTDLQNITLGYTITVGNLSWSNYSSSYTDFHRNMSYNYVLLNSSFPPNKNLTTYYWLSVPTVYAGYYEGGVYICGNYTSIC